MEIMTLIYLLVFIVFALVATAVLQIRMAGIKVKDFWSFIQANQMLDQLYKFSKRYKIMSPQEQIIFLSEAEKVFAAYDKIPSIIWEDEYRKYSEVLQAYQNVRVTRWSEENTIKNDDFNDFKGKVKNHHFLFRSYLIRVNKIVNFAYNKYKTSY